MNKKTFRLTLIAAVLATACSTNATTPMPVAEPAPPSSDQAALDDGPAAKTEGLAAGSVAAPAEPAAQDRAHVDELEERRELKAMAKSTLAGAAAMPAAPSPAANAIFVRQAQAQAAIFAPPPSASDTENYARLDSNPVQRAAEQPVSTFSVDVDTASYSNVRRFLNEGRLPPADAVRVEEMINYFRYADAGPANSDTPFAVSTELALNPWNAKTRLLRVGIKGYAPTAPLPPSNLVFLVDVSGSMDEPNKLPLVKAALKLLVARLGAQDRISLVTYAGNTAVVLEPTPGNEKVRIEQAIDHLDAGGSTNGAGGITLAYLQAQKAFIKGGNNRVLLATDGDFNVGLTRFESLIDLVKEKRKSGVAMTTLGFGTGNYNDHLMEQVADAGDGNYSYIDSLREAQKVLVAQRAATLLTIAKDVKIQVEFNPAVVAEYRLVGYENRALKREDFANDAVDAGEIGAGHSVTALYEVALVGEGGERSEALRYSHTNTPSAGNGELAFVRLRYKRPHEDQSQLIERPVRLAEARGSIAAASADLRLAAAAAAFGQKLGGGKYTGSFGYPQIVALARTVPGDEEVSEFIQLIGRADALSTHAQAGGATVAD